MKLRTVMAVLLAVRVVALSFTPGVAWQDTVQGNSFTQYLSRTVSETVFFRRQTLDITAVLLLAGLVIVLVGANPVLRGTDRRESMGWNGL